MYTICTTKLDQEIKVTYSCVLQMLHVLQIGIPFVTEVLTFTKMLMFYWHVTGTNEGRYKLHTDQCRRNH